LDLKELKAILQILEEREIEEFELEEQGLKLRIRKAAAGNSHVLSVTPAAAPVASAPAAAAVAGPVDSRPTPAPAPAGGPAPVEEGLHIIKSPIVGTFYRARDPNSPPFVDVGDRVKIGQALCIIEAMKMMNEIECEVAGEVVRVLPENGQPVQYGEPLFAVRT
jgi:acetyl-CoA carboxylase biotin carboxyl carrier protein